MNDLIRAKLKEIVKLQDIIKKDDLNYKSKCRQTYNFGKYLLPIIFLRDMYEAHLSAEKTDNQSNNFANELKNCEKTTKTFEENCLV